MSCEDDLENPCFLCYDNEDDYVPPLDTHTSSLAGACPLVCLKCGLMICGVCNKDSKALLAKLTRPDRNTGERRPRCTVCNTAYDASPEERYRSGWQCISNYRDPGRHTRVIQYLLGTMALFGTGTAPSLHLGINLLSKSASAGYVVALKMLLLVHQGIGDWGFEKNQDEMEKWLTFQAESTGSTEHQYELGQTYIGHSETIKRNPQKAAEWFCLAAEQGHAEAMLALGLLYRHNYSWILEVDIATANPMHWFQKSMEHGNAQAARELGYLRQHGWQSKRTGKRTRDDHPGAYQAYLVGAEQGHAESAYMLAELLTTRNCKGSGLAYDFDEAMKWWHKSAENGCEKAQMRLGYVYMYETHRDPTVRDSKEAIQLFHRAAEEHDNNDACFELGYFYACRVGTVNAERSDCDKAIHFWTCAAGRRHSLSQVVLWKLYASQHDLVQILPQSTNPTCRSLFLDSFDAINPAFKSTVFNIRLPHGLIPPDKEKAFRRCKIAADGYWTLDDHEKDMDAVYTAGDAESIFILGCMHFSGYGTPKDIHQANRYWKYLVFESHEDKYWSPNRPVTPPVADKSCARGHWLAPFLFQC